MGDISEIKMLELAEQVEEKEEEERGGVCVGEFHVMVVTAVVVLVVAMLKAMVL